MAVRAFRIENFMAFGEASAPYDGWIELRPICLLFGRNSSGKSAVIRALRLLKQSLIDAPPGSPFAYSIEDGVDVGSFPKMAHRPYPLDDPPIVRFGFRCDVSPRLLGRLVRGDTPVAKSDAWVDLTLGFGIPEKRNPQQAALVSLLIETPIAVEGTANRERVILLGADLIGPPADEGIGLWWKFWSDLLVTDDEDSIWQFVNVAPANVFLPDLTVSSEVLEEMSSRGQSWISGTKFDDIRSLLGEMRGSIKSFCDSIQHMLPLRPEPKRLFVLDNSQQRRWRQQGLVGYLALLQKRFTDAQRTTLAYWLEKLDLGISIEPKSHVDGASDRAVVTELLLDEGERGVHDINLADMGFGVSQVLPVLIQAILAEPGQLVIIEQPELHLHPAAQAELGDLFLQLALAENGPRFLLETHSEHLILRVMRRMRNTVRDELPKQIPPTTPDNIGVYVTSRDKQESFSRIHRMDISAEGRLLEPWPGGFFEEGFRERFAKEETGG